MTIFQLLGFLGSDYPGVRGRYSDIFIYIYVRSIFFFGSKFQKSNTFGSMKIRGYFWGVITKSEYFFFFWGGGGGVGEVISIHFRAFKVKTQNGNIFWPAKFQIFLGIPDIRVFFLLYNHHV